MVGSYFDDATQVWHGFLTDGNTFIVLDVPNVPGQHPGTFVTGIDNAGRIVGYYGDDLDRENKPGIHGFLGTPVAEDVGSSPSDAIHSVMTPRSFTTDLPCYRGK
jgi:hypothetical protein